MLRFGCKLNNYTPARPFCHGVKTPIDEVMASVDISKYLTKEACPLPRYWKQLLFLFQTTAVITSPPCWLVIPLDTSTGDVMDAPWQMSVGKHLCYFPNKFFSGINTFCLPMLDSINNFKLRLLATTGRSSGWLNQPKLLTQNSELLKILRNILVH